MVKVHSTERTLKFYPSCGWTVELIQQVSECAVIYQASDNYGEYFYLGHGEIITERLMSLVSKIVNWVPYTAISKKNYARYITDRRLGTHERLKAGGGSTSGDKGSFVESPRAADFSQQRSED